MHKQIQSHADKVVAKLEVTTRLLFCWINL